MIRVLVRLGNAVLIAWCCDVCEKELKKEIIRKQTETEIARHDLGYAICEECKHL